MRRGWPVALLVVALVASVVAWWGTSDRAVAPDGGGVEDGAPEEPPVEVGAPALSAAPARSPAAAPPTEPAAGETQAVADASALAGPVTVRLELPTPEDPSLATLPVVLRASSRQGEAFAWSPPSNRPGEAGKEGFPGTWREPDVAWLVPVPVASGGSVPAWRITDLPAGEWCFRAARLSEGDPGAGVPLAWGPVVARISGDSTEVTLPLATPSNSGLLRLTATERGAVSKAGFRILWRGHAFASLSTPDSVRAVEARVPAGEDLVVEAASGDAPRAGPVDPQTVRVAANAVEEVVFELPPMVTVALAVFRPGSEPVTRASYAIWRLDPARPPQHVQTDRQWGEAEAHKGPWQTRLSAGEYHVLVTDVPPFLPVWSRFQVGADGPQTIEVHLARTGPEAVCLLQRPDGTLATGYGLWLGRLDGPSPADAATSMVTTDAEGRANFGPLPDGEYLVADYGRSVWRTIRVEAGRVEPSVLRLPPPSGGAGARLRGRVRAPSGERVLRGLVSFGPPDDWRAYAHYEGGRFDLAASAGEGLLTVHHTWFADARFAAWTQTVVVEPGKDQAFDIRLRPR